MSLRGRLDIRSELLEFDYLNGIVAPKQVSVTLNGRMGTPNAEAVFEVRDGKPICVEFSVKAKTEGRGVRQADLAGANLLRIAEEAFLEFASTPEGSMMGGADAAETRSLRKVIETAIHAAARGASVAELRMVAKIYREHKKAPTVNVEEQLGYSRSTAKRRVREARDAGLL